MFNALPEVEQLYKAEIKRLRIENKVLNEATEQFVCHSAGCGSGSSRSA